MPGLPQIALGTALTFGGADSATSPRSDPNYTQR